MTSHVVITHRPPSLDHSDGLLRVVADLHTRALDHTKEFHPDALGGAIDAVRAFRAGSLDRGDLFKLRCTLAYRNDPERGCAAVFEAATDGL